MCPFHNEIISINGRSKSWHNFSNCNSTPLHTDGSCSVVLNFLANCDRSWLFGSLRKATLRTEHLAFQLTNDNNELPVPVSDAPFLTLVVPVPSLLV